MKTRLVLFCFFALCLPVGAEMADLACYPSGDALEVSPTTFAARDWMDREGFYPWAWVDGGRERIPGLYTTGYRGEVAFLSAAESAGFTPEPLCWELAKRYGPQN